MIGSFRLTQIGEFQPTRIGAFRPTQFGEFRPTRTLTAENAAKAGFSGFRQKGNVDYVRSFHRAYDGVVWERDFVSADDLTILRDCLISKSRHEYAQVFHLGEDIRVLSADHQEVLLQLADTGYHVRLRQYGEPAELEVVRSDLQHPGAKMLGIDTILGTVCIVEKSIYSGGLANVGRWPAFFVPGNRGVALRQRRRKRRQ